MTQPAMARLPYALTITHPCRWLLLAPGSQQIFGSLKEAHAAHLEAVVRAFDPTRVRRGYQLPTAILPIDGEGNTVAIARDPDGGVRLLHAFPDAQTARARILDLVHDSLCGDMCEGEDHRIKVSVEIFTVK